MSIVHTTEISLNEIKPFILANVKLQCTKHATTRMSIIGSPGCGKSDIMRQICEEQGWGLVVKYLSNLSMEQITGIPCHVEKGEEAQWSLSDLCNLSKLDYKPDNYEIGKTPTVILIDDFHLADKIIQKYLFQFLTYKAIGNSRLPENTAIIMAGNKITDKALAHSIPAPVMNRISVYEVKADKKDWIQNFAFKHGVRDDIISFINSRGDEFLVQEPIESSPWASPRSWTFLSEQMDVYEEMFGSLPIDKLNIIANGLIGAEYASEFIAYREIFAKWNIDLLFNMSNDKLANLFTEEISKNSINAYAIINSTMTWMINKSKEMNYDTHNPLLKKIIDFAYNILTIVLNVKCNGVQIKPLVISGLNYMYLYTQSITDLSISAKFKKVRITFLKNLEQKRAIDWLLYEIISYIFNIELDSNDKREIEKAKANFKI